MLRKIAKSILLAILSGVILALPFINGKLWICAWFAFIPLFSALNAAPKIKTFLFLFAAGTIFWSITIYWLVHVTLLGTLILILYLALYFVAFGLLIRKYLLRSTWYSILFIPSVWVLLEYVRSHLFTGFPWALLAYSQYQNLPIIQVADITGAWGVSFLVATVNVAIYQILGSRFSVLGKRKVYYFVLLFIAVTLGYGYHKLNLKPRTQHLEPIRISVIQGNIPQELKWEPSAKPYILDKYEKLTKIAADERPDLIVWPEASSPGLLGEDNLVFQEIFSLARNVNTPLLIGTVARDGEEYFNSAILVNSTGEIAGRYEKLHLVPFGEYIPLKKYLPFLETVVPIGDISAGKEYIIFEIPNPKSQIPNNFQIPISKFKNKFSVLICFEDLFPELSREFVRRGANFLINITNDAWYKQTTAPYQHLEASVFRAVENRRWLVRSANTGISGFINPCGKIVSLVSNEKGKQIFVDGVDTQKIVIQGQSSSFYNRFGDYFILICLLFVLYGALSTK